MNPRSIIVPITAWEEHGRPHIYLELPQLSRTYHLHRTHLSKGTVLSEERKKPKQPAYLNDMEETSVACEVTTRTEE